MLCLYLHVNNHSVKLPVQSGTMNTMITEKKAGIVALVGRPNVGKSTLLNHLLGQKVSITSPKAQTTQFTIQAIYEDNRGQIVFVDTPGNFTDIKKADVVLYMIDHTRERGVEENKMLGEVRKIEAPKILVINKIDIRKPSHIVQYKFMEEEVDRVVQVSALTNHNLNLLLDAIFEYLPEGPAQDVKQIDSRLPISEIIREKAFLFLRDEVPYTLTVVVDEVTHRRSGTTYIKARILTSADRYKSMIIGTGGKMIKEISQAARKELETASNKKVFLDLTVETSKRLLAA